MAVRRFLILRLVPSLSFAVLWSATCVAGPPQWARDNIVRLHVGSEADPKLSDWGYGIVIGERSGIVFAVTTRHLLFGEEGQLPGSNSSRRLQRVVLHNGEATTGTAESILLQDVDIAFVRFNKPERWKWHKACLSEHASDSEVWHYGGENWSLPGTVGYVETYPISSKRPQSETMRVIGLSAKPHASGTALVNEKGMIGMLTGEGDHEVIGVPLSTVPGLIKSRNLDLPWELRERKGKPVAATVCAAILLVGTAVAYKVEQDRWDKYEGDLSSSSYESYKDAQKARVVIGWGALLTSAFTGWRWLRAEND